MKHYLVSIIDPGKEKLVTDILHEIEGVEVERIPKSGKVNGRSKSKKGKPPTAAEKRFMAELTQAVQEVKDHVSGKKKLQSARAFLNEL